MFKRILVPTDGSDLSSEAVIRAISFAKEAGAFLTFVCVAQPFPPMYYGSGAIFDPHLAADFQERGTAVAREILERAAGFARASGVACQILALVSEHPFEAIIEAAGRDGSDLIFMASHGRRGFKGWVLGSETQKVLTHSSIPVLVYRSENPCAG